MAADEGHYEDQYQVDLGDEQAVSIYNQTNQGAFNIVQVDYENDIYAVPDDELVKSQASRSRAESGEQSEAQSRGNESRGDQSPYIQDKNVITDEEVKE